MMRFGVLGAGRIGKVHARTIAASGKAKVAYLADAIPKAAADLAAEVGAFTLEDVAREVNEKLVRRHPHVFGTGKLGTSDEVLVQWEQIKAQEKKHGPVASGVFKDLPGRLPALMFAEAVWKQIEKKSLPVPEASIVDVAQVKALGARLTEAEAARVG